MRVGLNLPQYAVDFETGACDPHRVIEIARFAERAGFDSVWVSDHPFVIGPGGRASGALEPLTMLGAIAAQTDRIVLGTLVLAADMRAPEHTEMAARTLGAIAPGRVTLGIGAGWYRPTHDAYGISIEPIEHRVAILEQHLRAAKAGGAKALAGGTHPALLAVTAREADSWNVAWDLTPQQFTEANHEFDRVCAREARDPKAIARSVGVTVCPVDTPDGFRESCERLKVRLPKLSDLSTDGLVARIVSGVPDRCDSRLRSYDADEVIVTLFLRDDQDMLELFASEILPRLRS